MKVQTSERFIAELRSYSLLRRLLFRIQTGMTVEHAIESVLYLKTVEGGGLFEV